MWHRRFGKDDVMLNWTATQVMERPASYWHCLPEFAQCRRAIWTAVDPTTGARRIDQAFPKEIRESANEQEMFIRFKNGSTWQMVGSDRYNNLVGAGVAGVCFSEFALANPSSWGYIRPMVEANNGWATFISTPRGRNHFKDLFEMAQKNPRWFAQALSIYDTGSLTAEQLQEAREEYHAMYGVDMGDAVFSQEYEVSFNAAILGAFYAREMAAVRAEDRIIDDLEHDPSQPVHTAWDIGVGDDTSIWFFQVVGRQVLVLDYYACNSVGVDAYADHLEAIYKERGWTKGKDFVPHDARAREWGSGRTRVETMLSLGLKPNVVPNVTVMDGINAVRQTLPRCVFSSRCDNVERGGLAALEQYRREWDDDKKTFRPSPLHDWSSHAADSFRYMALAWKEMRPEVVLQKTPKAGIVTADYVIAPALPGQIGRR
jgi:phage terminase large subunit